VERGTVTTVLVWLRRDLRLADNAALHAAVGQGAAIIPVYIHCPSEAGKWALGGASRWWLHHSLSALSRSLEGCGSRLVLRAAGSSADALIELAQETGAAAVHWNRLYEPQAIERDVAVQERLRESGIEARIHEGDLLFSPHAVRSQSGFAFQVFTPFWNACLKQEEPRAPWPTPRSLPAPKVWPATLTPDGLDLLSGMSWEDGFAKAWVPGESAGLARLHAFLTKGLETYAAGRDIPAHDGVSRMSPYLHFGEISPRHVWHAVRGNRTGDSLSAGAAAYLRELGWREFAQHVLYHWPRTAEEPLRREFAKFPWRPLPEGAPLLRAWQKGRTGIPWVDAGMRELWATGWMHNRVRMSAASYLTKHCRLPWQVGAQWFWDTLVDADLANNSLNWQWSAGCGADAAPYFRIFNPAQQAQRYDPDGTYIRKWVPELAKLPVPWIFRPWDTPASVQAESGFQLGKDYPLPVVGLKQGREEALTAFAAFKAVSPD